VPNGKISSVPEPVPGPEAFRRTDDKAVLSQAATLLLLGAQLRGDEFSLRARAEAAGGEKLVDFITEEDAARFPIPRIPGMAGRFDIQRMQQSLAQRYGKWLLPLERAPEEARGMLPMVLPGLAERVFAQPTYQAAAELMEVSLWHPAELTRVAAAASYFELSTEPARLLDILATGAQSNDELVREVAATSLAAIDPNNSVLLRLTQASATAGAAGAPDTTVLIHGTWAANSSWWQPGGDFHSYILAGVRPDLYKDFDRFGWSGVYSDAARLQAAQDLVAWVTAHNENGLDLITHSHGGSVAMLATHSGLRIGELVLLSCPVHIPKYLPDFTQVSKIVSIRVHLDLVILADRGGQRFHLPQIQENVLPIWFHHSATHDPNVWIEHNVPAML
jgi:hypothetical protein